MAKPSKRTLRKWKKELKEKRGAEEWLREQLLECEKEMKNVKSNKPR